MTCSFVQVFWLKDNVELNVQEDINLIISSEGSLIINQARLVDSGNYTCGAVNAASRRLSDSATLTVFSKFLWIIRTIIMDNENDSYGLLGQC